MADAGPRHGAARGTAPLPPGRLTGGRAFLSELEARSREIKDPAEKLRFIRSSLEGYRASNRWVEGVPFAPLRRALSRHYRLQGLDDPRPAAAPGRRVATDAARRVRPRRPAAALTAVLAAAAGVAAFALRPPLREAAPPLERAGARARPVLHEAAQAAPSQATPPVPAGVKPAEVWIVEKGEAWEQYSNGLRIDASFAVRGEPRRYRTYGGATGDASEVSERPVGILFHTSESDLWPLEAAYNENLRDSSQRLLRYVRRLRLYNYLIDRFGRVFRVVEEAQRAHHAGHSIWADGDAVYLSLNNAFLGICFETRWEGGQALPITEAQLSAGRSLTEYLRQKWRIEGRMCVAHGLTSVNPHKHLIGHHVDWARGFPFEAFGLPDQYARPTPSVALFGFGYDEEFVKVLGEPWAGVRAAERALAEEARRQGRSVQDLRRDRQALYDGYLERQARDEQDAGVSRADGAGARSLRSGG